MRSGPVSCFWLAVPLQLLLSGLCTDGYRPVVIVHGLFDGPKQFKTLTLLISKAHPGTEVSFINLYDGLSSLRPLWKQVRDFRQDIQPIMKKAPDGIHLICFSQGGLICRALLSTMPDHNVQNFIALSAPLAGQYGDTDYLRWLFPKYMKKTIFHICYSTAGQSFSICNYWNDPHHRDRYLHNNTFLALLNGDAPHAEMKVWRENFLQIKKLVLIGGPDDGVITPWQSSLFGFFDSSEKIVEMRNQEVSVKGETVSKTGTSLRTERERFTDFQWFYRNDAFGLKTLDARGDISVCVHSGVLHIQWHSNQTVFDSCLEKWLT